jgi:hypothetical protein
MLTEVVTRVTAFWDWTTHDPVSFYTAVLALSTIALWIVTWRGIRGQSKDIRILQRAYVSVEPGGLTAHVDRSDRLHTTVTFRNVGHLPARDVRWYGTFATLGPDGGWRGNPDGNDFPVKETGGKIVFPVKKPTGGKIVLPPGTASTHHIGTVFTDRLQNSLFVWGIVTYDDGFGKQRFTRFCHLYPTKAIINRHDVTLPADNAVLPEYGNDAD